jgi:PEGA domain
VPTPTPMPATPPPVPSADRTAVVQPVSPPPAPRPKVVVNPPPARPQHVVNVPSPATPTVRGQTPLRGPRPSAATSSRPPTAPGPASPDRTSSGQRLVLALAGAVGALVVVVGLWWALRPSPGEPTASGAGPTLAGSVASALPATVASLPRPPVTTPAPPVAPPSLAPTPAPVASAPPRETRPTPRAQPSAARSTAPRLLPTPAPSPVRSSAPPPVVEAKGVLRLRIRPYAQIFVDGAEMGTTPALRTVDLPPGDHVVRLVHPDYQPLQRRVTIVSGESYDLQVNLAEQGFPRSPP